MDKELLIKEIPTALEFDIKPDCRKFWDDAIECVCRNRRVSKCRRSRQGRLILIAEDGTEDSCSVSDLKTPILRKVAELKKAAGISAEGVPHETIESAQHQKVAPQSDDAYWRKFRKALQDQLGVQTKNGKNLFIDTIDDWDRVKAELLTQLTLPTFFAVKYTYKTVPQFAEAIKKQILLKKPDFGETKAEACVNNAISEVSENVLVSW